MARTILLQCLALPDVLSQDESILFFKMFCLGQRQLVPAEEVTAGIDPVFLSFLLLLRWKSQRSLFELARRNNAVIYEFVFFQVDTCFIFL